MLRLALVLGLSLTGYIGRRLWGERELGRAAIIAGAVDSEFPPALSGSLSMLAALSASCRVVGK